MAETTIDAYSISIDGSNKWVREAQKVCQKRGSNHYGPGTPPTAQQSHLKLKFTTDDDSILNWLVELELSDEEQRFINFALNKAEIEDGYNCALFKR